MVAKILARERHAGLRDRLVDARAEERDRARVERGLLRRATRPCRAGTRQLASSPAVGGRHGAPEQHREVLDPRSRQREERLEQKVQQQVVAPDVDDEGDVGPDRGDVGEVLIGPDADVRAAACTPRFLRSGTTSRYERSFEMRLSVSKYPAGSESAATCGRERRLRFRPRATAGEPPREREEQAPRSRVRAGAGGCAWTSVQALGGSAFRRSGPAASTLANQRCSSSPDPPIPIYVSSYPLIGRIQMLRKCTGFP